MKISEFMKRVGATKDAVRHYVELGLLRPIVLENGRREYGEKDILDFQAIKEMQELDMSLKEIQVMFEVKRTRGCGSQTLLREVIQTMEEKVVAATKEERRLAENREQMQLLITTLQGVNK